MTKEKFPNNTHAIETLNRKLNEVHLKIKESHACQQREAEIKAILKLKENPRYFYSYAKKFAKKKTTIGPLLDSENNLQQDPSRKNG